MPINNSANFFLLRYSCRSALPLLPFFNLFLILFYFFFVFDPSQIENLWKWVSCSFSAYGSLSLMILFLFFYVWFFSPFLLIFIYIEREIDFWFSFIEKSGAIPGMLSSILVPLTWKTVKVIISKVENLNLFMAFLLVGEIRFESVQEFILVSGA